MNNILYMLQSNDNSKCKRVLLKEEGWWKSGQVEGVRGGYQKLDTGYWILDTGYWILDTGYWILDTGYYLFDS
jgi:hypothetical protein